MLQRELEQTREILKEKNAIIRALEVELKSLKRLLDVQEKLLDEKDSGQLNTTENT